jgi:hypothetical protein
MDCRTWIAAICLSIGALYFLALAITAIVLNLKD